MCLLNFTKKMEKLGFLLSADYISSRIDHSLEEIERDILNHDLRQKPACCLPYFPSDINSQQDTRLIGPVVLQIVSVYNLNQPSSRRHENVTPRLLGVQLTDGHTKAFGIEVSPLVGIQASTPPGG
jgi:hypothetical protein